MADVLTASYAQTAKQEDVLNVLYRVAVEKVPFLNLIGRGRATYTKHEWLTESLAAASTSNAHLEGAETDAPAGNYPTKVYNHTQIAKKLVKITNTAEAVKQYGKGSETTHQLTLMGKELLNDIESSILNNQASVAGTSAVAGKVGGLPAWISTNASRGTTGALATGNGQTAATDGTPRALTLDMIKDVVQQMYTEGADIEGNIITCGAFNKGKISGFTGGITRYEDVVKNKLTLNVDMLETDFGSLTVKPILHQRARDVFIINPSMIKMAYLRPMMKQELAINGDARKFHLVSEYTLEVLNEKAHGVIADLTTS